MVSPKTMIFAGLAMMNALCAWKAFYSGADVWHLAVGGLNAFASGLSAGRALWSTEIERKPHD